MQLSEQTLRYLERVILGDGTSDYRSGPVLVSLFNKFGFQDDYGQGFPSRWMFVRGKLELLNGTRDLGSLVQQLFSPANYINREDELAESARCLNKYLEFDGYELQIRNRRCTIRVASDSPLVVENVDSLSDEFVNDQLRKIDDKLSDGDYDGAITNARSFVEGVLNGIHRSLQGSDLPKSGELRQDYKKVRALLGLGAEDQSDEAVKQVLNALTSVIDGIDTLSNRMGDRHRRSYRPERRHAKLVANSAKVLVDFLIDTHRARGA